MVIIAKTRKGSEFVYNSSTAHAVTKRDGGKIAEKLNALNYDLKQGEMWHVYNIDKYSNAFQYADNQHFTLHRNGLITRRRYS